MKIKQMWDVLKTQHWERKSSSYSAWWTFLCMLQHFKKKSRVFIKHQSAYHFLTHTPSLLFFAVLGRHPEPLGPGDLTGAVREREKNRHTDRKAGPGGLAHSAGTALTM